MNDRYCKNGYPRILSTQCAAHYEAAPRHRNPSPIQGRFRSPVRRQPRSVGRDRECPLGGLAGELDCTPGDVLRAVESAGIDPITDTARSKGQEDHDRPTAPELRCLALTIEDARTLKSVLG